jgi:large subunit ribosomal protein L14
LIFKESLLRIIDNSGAKRVLCIKVLRHPIAKPTHTVIVTVKSLFRSTRKDDKKSIKKGHLYQALLCFTKVGPKRMNGYSLRAPFNAAIILRKDKSKVPFANRVKFPVPFELRDVCSKVLLLAPDIF